MSTGSVRQELGAEVFDQLGKATIEGLRVPFRSRVRQLFRLGKCFPHSRNIAGEKSKRGNDDQRFLPLSGGAVSRIEREIKDLRAVIDLRQRAPTT